ncbi:hypothetical protein DL238_15575 [Alteriqipengyuania lutimaris]|uniref:Uncharacterized protein n=2 Tax=Alteriqipengyuania lutimaris TaxID=1538146 RepID=A0A395LGZ6_9SPHN|nr:hypothetical protein DL238_15575 [Alteriqipengyuania lutimaris]
MSAAVAALLLGSTGASAREFGDITGPYMEKHGDWKKTRSALRKQLKNRQPMSGDDWFVLAAMCDIVPPSGPSKIMNLANGSPCREEVIEYFVNAGMNGTPNGFERAAFYILRRGGSVQQAWPYFALAERLGGQDPDLRRELDELLPQMRGGLTEAQRIEVNTTAMKLVADGVYSGSAQVAGEQQGYRSPPPIARGGATNLRWLNFDDPARCEWSAEAVRLMEGSYRFDDNRMTNLTVPATTRLPGGGGNVTGRVSWPSGRNSNRVQIDVDFTGSWNGLSVLGLTDAFLEESEGLFGKGIRFAEPVAEVARALRSAGFVVNLDGSDREQVDDVETTRFEGKVYRNINGVVTSITRQDGETIFLCNHVYQIMG